MYTYTHTHTGVWGHTLARTLAFTLTEASRDTSIHTRNIHMQRHVHMEIYTQDTGYRARPQCGWGYFKPVPHPAAAGEGHTLPQASL